MPPRAPASALRTTASSALRPVSGKRCWVIWRVREPVARPTDHALTGSALPFTAKGSSSTVPNSVFERSSTSAVA